LASPKEFVKSQQPEARAFLDCLQLARFE